MRFSRVNKIWSLSLAVLLVAGVLLINLRAAEEDSADSATETATEATAASQPDPAFVVPEGSVDQKLAFLNKLTRPTEMFTSAERANHYWSQAAAAMKSGAEQVLAAKPTGEQASEAVQFKAEALRILATLGDKHADGQRSQFLNKMLKDPRIEVSSVVGPLRLIPKMRRWHTLDEAQRAAAINEFVADVKAAGPTPGQAELLIGLGDSLTDSPDRALVAKAVDQLLPEFRESGSPTISRMVPMLEGQSRLLDLPGNKIELEGTLLSGKPFDWESYRGKVVLIDFWASWCGECIKEVPNILANYRAYHDKGFEVIGVCLDNDRTLAEQTIRQTGMIWPQLFTETPSGDGWTHPLAEKYSITAIPRAILVDQKGNVVTLLARGELLDADLENLLGPADESKAATGPQLGAPRTDENAAR